MHRRVDERQPARIALGGVVAVEIPISDSREGAPEVVGVLFGARRFSEIREGMPLISRSLLTQRLRELEDAGVIQSRPLPRGRGREYRPTAAGEEFREVLEQLGAWGQRWARGQFDLENLDLRMLMWNVRHRIDTRCLPPRRRGFQTCWLILTREDVDVCLKDPGFEVNLVVTADAAAMARVWTGAITFAQAVRSGGLRVEGARDLVQAFPTWLLLSHFAHVERPARAG
jgi:DNA-binding HxlR family transcriptional regulator